MQYFATDAHLFDLYNFKIKSGSIIDLTPEQAEVYNGLVPGLLEVYDAAVHTPAPIEPAPGFDTASVTDGTAPADVPATDAPADMTAPTTDAAPVDPAPTDAPVDQDPKTINE